MSDRPVLGIDVGGGSAKIGIIAVDGTILARTRVPSDPSLSPTALIDSFLAAGGRLQQEIDAPELAGVGVGLPGQIDHVAGTTRLCNVQSLNGFPIVDHIRRRTGLAASIENDATLAALGEHSFGAGRGSNRFMTVTLGTGIGVGFIVDGRPVHSSHGTLGDIGHVIVDATGSRSCRQGCRGCLESVASGTAIAERFAAVEVDPDSEPAEDLSPLFAAARSGDSRCIEIIDEAARFLAAGIVSWIHIFSPDRIAFAGGLSVAGPILLDRIVTYAHRLAMAEYLDGLAFQPAELGNDAGFVGAAAYAFARREEDT